MLTVLQQKLAEAHGLAISASIVTRKVAERVEDPGLLRTLEAMRADAEETRERCAAAEQLLPAEVADEARAHAVSTSETGADLVGSWFKAGTDPLRAWMFLAMGEAAEVAAWSSVGALAAAAKDTGACELAEWALPVQQRHLTAALEGSVLLAGDFDPTAPRWG